MQLLMRANSTRMENCRSGITNLNPTLSSIHLSNAPCLHSEGFTASFCPISISLYISTSCFLPGFLRKSPYQRLDYAQFYTYFMGITEILHHRNTTTQTTPIYFNQELWTSIRWRDPRHDLNSFELKLSSQVHTDGAN